MKVVSVVFQISNGFLIVDPDGDNAKYTDTWDPFKPYDHQPALRKLIFAADGKISAIKAVREYCNTHNIDEYKGLKDSKDFVESIRFDWPTLSLTPRPPLTGFED